MKRLPRNIPTAVRKAVLERDSNACRDCGLRHERVTTKTGRIRSNLELHHIIEYENGGLHTPENLITVCTKCHKRRDKEHNTTLERSRQQDRVDLANAKGFITHAAAAKLLGTSVFRVRTLIRQKQLTPYRNLLSSRLKLVSRSEVEKLKNTYEEAA